MTTIVVVRKNGFAAIAADTLTTFGNTRLTPNNDASYDKITRRQRLRRSGTTNCFGSQLEDHCPICGRPTIIAPMRGDFRLRLLQENPLFSTYAVDHLAFTAGTAPGPHYTVFGQGLYQVGSEVGLFQKMFLEVYVDDGTTPNTMLVFHDYPAAPLIFEVRGLPEKAGAEKMDHYRGVGVGIVVECEGGSMLIPGYTGATMVDKNGAEIKKFSGIAGPASSRDAVVDVPVEHLANPPIHLG